MSKTREEELLSEAKDERSRQYEEWVEQYIDGEITEKEFEEKVGNMMKSGDDFIERDHTHSTAEKIEKKLQYYSLPLLILSVVGVSFLALPAGMAFTILPVTFTLSLILWGVLKLKGIA